MAKNKNAKKLDLTNLVQGVYLNEVSFGQLHLLDEVASPYGGVEYFYKGRIHKGTLNLSSGGSAEHLIPAHKPEAHGYTLQGEARKLFEATNALTVQDDKQDSTYIYINPKSTLKYIGNPTKEYELYIRIFNDFNAPATLADDNRWAVIYAKAA